MKVKYKAGDFHKSFLWDTLDPNQFRRKNNIKSWLPIVKLVKVW